MNIWIWTLILGTPLIALWLLTRSGVIQDLVFR